MESHRGQTSVDSYRRGRWILGSRRVTIPELLVAAFFAFLLFWLIVWDELPWYRSGCEPPESATAVVGGEKPQKPAAENPSPAAAELLKDFKGKKWFWEQLKVGDEIVKLGDKCVVPAIAELLASPDRHVRINAGSVLARLGDDRGFQAIVEELYDQAPRPVTTGGPVGTSDGGPDVQGQIKSDRYFAVRMLGQVGDSRALPVLIEMLEDKSIDYAAAMALGELGDKQAIPALQEFLKTARGENKLWAGQGLARLGDPIGMATVVGFLKDPHSPHWGYRRHAVECLAVLHDQAAVIALIDATKDESADVRIAVAKALGKIGDRSAEEALEALLSRDESDRVRDAAAKALEQIAAAAN